MLAPVMPLKNECADNAAFAPSPAAIIVCLNCIEVTSPAEKTPGQDVWHLLFTTISFD